MSIDAIALLPPVAGLRGRCVEGGWKRGKGPGGAQGLWLPLRDGVLLNLGFPIQTPDADLYALARQWVGVPPERVWVFPDTDVPDEDTSSALQAATHEVGRWVSAEPSQRSHLEGLGFSREEEVAWQREMNSGNPKRVQAAVALLEKRLEGRDPAELEALLAKILRRG